MKKTLQKFGWLLAVSLAIAGMLLLCVRQTPLPKKKAPAPAAQAPVLKPESVLQFRVEGAPDSAPLVPYAISGNTYYVFLPSFAQLNQVQTLLPESVAVSVGDTWLTDGMDCGIFALETEYPLVIDGRETGTLQFMRSANVPTLYIDTASGSMSQIHADKEHEEGAVMTLVSENGTLLHRDDGCMLKGRGNATWIPAKKPYLLTLSAEGDLLGMGAATKWVLLTNAVDETQLRNKLVMELAAGTGLAWTPEAEFVDVYLNGQYYGLYLLSEKVEAGPNRLNLDLENDDFLCRVEAEWRWEILRHPIRTPSGRTLEISEPKQLTTRKKDNIAARVAQMETYIYSDGDLTLAPDFDLDSWVRRYLVDEISANNDAEITSSYFYSVDGVIYGGPIWDYDKSLGNTFRSYNPATFLSRNKYASDGTLAHYYDALYDNESFQMRLREIYRTEFRPVLDRLMNGWIREQAEQISQASRINNLRWQSVFADYYGREEIIPSDVDALYAYLEKRIAFLDSAWLDGTEYCVVQFEYDQNGYYWNTTVEKGSTLRSTGVDMDNNLWFDTWTGEAVSADTVITENRMLTRNYVPQEELTEVLVTRLSIAAMAAMLVILLAVDFRLRRKERRKANERADAQIPS